MERYGDLVDEATLGNDLVNEVLVTLLEVLLGFRPTDRTLGLEQTRINRNVGESVLHQDQLALRVDWASVC